MKACRDCRYFVELWGHYCERPELLKDDPINGHEYAWPRMERSEKGRCGPEAKFFEQKPTARGFFAKLFGRAA